MGLDCTDNGRRIVFCCSKPRAQLGTNETPSPLSTRTKTVVMRSGSCRTSGEKPARRHIATASSNRLGAPTRRKSSDGWRVCRNDCLRGERLHKM
jgi:hypothetical protein